MPCCGAPQGLSATSVQSEATSAPAPAVRSHTTAQSSERGAVRRPRPRQPRTTRRPRTPMRARTVTMLSPLVTPRTDPLALPAAGARQPQHPRGHAARGSSQACQSDATEPGPHPGDVAPRCEPGANRAALDALELRKRLCDAGVSCGGLSSRLVSVFGDGLAGWSTLSGRRCPRGNMIRRGREDHTFKRHWYRSLEP